jgi:hypothetical protein
MSECLCCGKPKQTKNRRKKTSRHWSENSGAFCGHECYAKHKAWMAARKARCKCGVATGLQRAICGKCKDREKWKLFAKVAMARLTHTPDEWLMRAQWAAMSLKLRARDTAENKHIRNQKECKTWIEAARHAMSRAKLRQSRPGRSQWVKRADTAARNIRRRSPANLSNWQKDRDIDVHCQDWN